MTVRHRPGLLVSVRSVAEADAALEGGADLIDVKEPTRGPLGAADPDVLQAVVAAVGGRAPVSAALGEWNQWTARRLPNGLDYVKWGLAGVATGAYWDVWGIWFTEVTPRRVLVAYADDRRADSPDPEWLAERAVELSFGAFLLDTAVKDGTTLLDWIAPATLARIRFRLADRNVPVALAGSLDAAAIRRLAPLAPDWFAVRGAACNGGRGGDVCAERVRHLKAVIAERAAAHAD